MEIEVTYSIKDVRKKILGFTCGRYRLRPRRGGGAQYRTETSRRLRCGLRLQHVL